ncbi:MAG TPA: dipeptidase [Phototrophicaceae bacterium]|jgi:acetylornithine deacetylase/succinyl-diaminopimelate desuccinylase-like protein|nr:dipeptidase [Phototrophicaceae bacterium]
MTTAHSYASENASRFRQQLYDLLRIPSVSTLPEQAGEVRRAAEWLQADMERIGFQSVEVVDTAGHPIVYGEWLGAGADAPTVLIYGHYDVQPAEMADGWTSNPFEPVERDGKVYARGSSDDKGQVFAHIKAIESLLKTQGKLPVNVKMIIEGEEEISSLHLGAFVTANQDRLAADVCIISDTSILTVDQPSIVYALRGLTYMELHVYGPVVDLHSGVFGGTVHNPAQALAEIITQLHNPDGSIAVPGFYDNVLKLDDNERAELKKTDWELSNWSQSTGLTKPWGEADYTLRERVGARPTLEINGLVSGFYGEGAKTVLPAKALAKMSCRLVANQDPTKIFELVRDYVAKITPPTVRSEVRLLHIGDPAYVDRNTPAMHAAITAYEKGWGKSPVFMREGGSIPIVANFQQELELPVVLMGFGLNSDGAHGPDEHFTIEMFHKGIDTSIYFLEEVAKVGKIK